MANYMSIARSAAMGEMAERVDKEVDARAWLGADSDFDQRLAFEWAFIRQRWPDSETVAYCTSKINALKAKCGEDVTSPYLAQGFQEELG